MATTFQLEIDDTSPLVSYFPFGDTLALPEPSAGWNPYYSVSGYVTQPDMVGEGSSSHRTTRDGATLALQWTGTGITIYGSVTDAAYTVALNGTIQDINGADPSQNILFSVDNLSEENHSLVLTTQMNSSMASFEFDRVVLTASTMLNGSTVNYMPVNVASVLLHGTWHEVADPSLDVSYYVSDEEDATASWSFNGTAIQVAGIRNGEAGDYAVTLDDKVFHYHAAASASEVALLFMQTGLKPDVTHNIRITNAGNGSLGFVSANVTSGSGSPLVATSASSPSSASAGYNKGTIAAIALAGVFGALFLVMLGFFLWRREHRKLKALRALSIPPDMSGLSKGHPPFSSPQPTYSAPSPPRSSTRLSRQHLGHSPLGTTGNVLVAPINGTLSQLHPYSSRDSDIEARYQAWYKDEERGQSPVGVEVPQLTLSGQVSKSTVPLPTTPRQDSTSSGAARKHKKGISFLDFASSASSSLRRSRSRSTRSRAPSASQSNSNSNSSARGKHQSGGQFSLSISVGDGPFPMSEEGGEYLTATVSASRRQSRIRSSSPTDSVPLTVSEIAFRQEPDVDEDRRTSGSHLPPHPPLPGNLGSPRIVQMLLGRTLPGASPLTPVFPDLSRTPGRTSTQEEVEVDDWIILPETNTRR